MQQIFSYSDVTEGFHRVSYLVFSLCTSVSFYCKTQICMYANGYGRSWAEQKCSSQSLQRTLHSWQDKRQWAHMGTQELPSEHQKTFNCVGDSAVQRGCGSSLLEDAQKPRGQGPGQGAIDGPAGLEVLDS